MNDKTEKMCDAHKQMFLKAARLSLARLEEIARESGARLEQTESCSVISKYFREEANKAPAPSWAKWVVIRNNMFDERGRIAKDWVQSKGVSWHKTNKSYFVHSVSEITGEDIGELRLDWLRFLVESLEKEVNVEV